MGVFPLFELLSYIVTVIGLPLAIFVFIVERRKERQNEESELFLKLSDDYISFLQVVLANADLKLLSAYDADIAFSEEQEDRKLVLFSLLVSLFERAYILLYLPGITGQRARLWRSWEDEMVNWCRRPDFRDALPQLLQGEDDAFALHMRKLAESPGAPRRFGAG